LCIATGASPFKPPVKGVDLDNVHVLRDAKDQTTIREKASKAKNVVILGGGFIGSECASSLKMKYGDA